MYEVLLTRRVTFSSGHRYWLPSLTAQENKERFGAWASPFNHGHNYVLDVSVGGAIQPSTGMVVNIKDIDAVLQDAIVRQFDQRSINDEIPAFADKSPSLENLILYIRSQLLGLPTEVELTSIRLEETPLLFGEWHAQNHEMVSISRVYEFASSHRLHSPALSAQENVDLFGKCNNPNGHGHNYLLEVTVEGEPDRTTGMIVDIKALDDVVNRRIVDRYDHKNLSVDVPEFAGKNPTSEVVAQEIFSALRGVLPAKLARVRLHETARNMFEIRSDD